MIFKLPRSFFAALLTCSSSVFFLSVTAHAQQTSAAPVSADSSSETESAKGNVTLDFKEADINTVLRVMSLKSGMNIVAGPEVQGTVTIRLEDVHWQKALDVVLRTYGYVYERDENVIRVTTRENLAQEPVSTKTFVLNYSKASEISEAVRDMLTERGRVKVAERTNMIVVTDIPTNIYRIEEVILKLDKVTPQAYIDSKVVRTAVGVAENLGIQWNVQAGVQGSNRPTTFPFSQTEGEKENISPVLRQFFPVGGATAFTTNPSDPRAMPTPTTVATATYEYGTLDFTDLTAVLQMLQSKSSTKVVSNPRVVVLNNQTANIQVGSDIPLPTFERNENTGSIEISGFSYREVGVVLNVTPHINSAEEILVDLKPEVSSVAAGAGRNYGGFLIPEFNVTKALTQVLIRSGETIAIGGLLSDNSADSQAKVPYLGDIPVVGKIFRSKRQSSESNSKVETLFFITVTMVDTEGQPTGDKADKDADKNGQTSAVNASGNDAAAQPVKKDEMTNAPAEGPATSPAQPEVQDVQPAAA